VGVPGLRRRRAVRPRRLRLRGRRPRGRGAERAGAIWSSTTVAGDDGARRVVLVDAADAPGIRFLAAWAGTGDPGIGTPVALAPPAPGEPLPRVAVAARAAVGGAR
jgi:hypothetical protein